MTIIVVIASIAAIRDTARKPIAHLAFDFFVVMVDGGARFHSSCFAKIRVEFIHEHGIVPFEKRVDQAGHVFNQVRHHFAL